MLTMPFIEHDLEKLANQFPIQTVASASLMNGAQAKIPHYHVEDLDNNRFFMAASPTMMQLYRNIRVLAPVDIPVDPPLQPG
jgi:two-component system response regulator AtoC